MRPLPAHTVGRARWLRDLCLRCPHGHALRVDLTKNDAMAIGEALDYVVRMEAKLWKPAKPGKAKP